MTKSFRKDTECCHKRGYNMEQPKTAICLLEANGKLPMTYPRCKRSAASGSTPAGGCFPMAMQARMPANLMRRLRMSATGTLSSRRAFMSCGLSMRMT